MALDKATKEEHIRLRDFETQSNVAAARIDFARQAMAADFLSKEPRG